MNNTILTEAFKQLEVLEEEAFDINSIEGTEDAKDFMDKDDSEDIVDVIDVYAEEEDELADSYIGKVILECNVCHSKIFEDADKVEIEGEDANLEEECPYCFSMDGYKVIGQVAPMGQVEEEIEVTEEEPVEAGDEEVNEALNESVSKDTLNELEEFLTINNISYRDFLDYLLNHVSDEQIHEVINEFNDVMGVNEALNECGKFKKGKCKNDALKEGDACTECGKNPCECEKELEEDFKDVSITTDDSHMTMTSDEDGKVTVTTEPVKDEIEDDFIEDEIGGDEMVAPVDDETMAEITDEPIEEPVIEDEDGVDVDMDEFDDEGFDELGESYLKKVYENVNSFKTTDIKEKGNKIKLEGVIGFTSGAKKKTSFIFEAKDISAKGKLRLIGENQEITRGKKAFTISGKMNGKKFMCESFNYNYRAKNENGKSTRLYGTIKRK